MQLSEQTAALREEYHLSRRTVGIIVTAVAPGSGAAAAGLEPGDVIRAVDRQAIESLRQFSSAMTSRANDRPITLSVKRRNQSFFVTLDPAS
jgi:serine protease Do